MKNEFLTELVCHPLPDGVRWRLEDHLKYLDLNGRLIVVPAGFTTDFASIPPLATIGGAVELLGALAFFGASWLGWSWLMLPAGVLVTFSWLVVMLANGLEHEGTYDEAAALHDYLYATEIRTFQQSNWILFKAMIARGGGHTVLWKRVVIWLAVALFGWFAWDSDARQVGGLKRTSPQT